MQNMPVVVQLHDGRKIPAYGEGAAKVADTEKFKVWLDEVSRNLTIKSINILGQVFINSSEGSVLLFGFVSFVCEELPYPVAALIAGEAVGVFIILEDENGKLWTVLVEQMRPVVGYRTIELPAGRIGDNDQLAGRAAMALNAAWREVGEETNINVPMTEFEYLGSYVSSQGLSDEEVRLFAVGPIRMNLSQIKLVDGAKAGLAPENEDITVRILALGPLMLADPSSSSNQVMVRALEDPKLSMALDRYRRAHVGFLDSLL